MRNRCFSWFLVKIKLFSKLQNFVPCSNWRKTNQPQKINLFFRKAHSQCFKIPPIGFSLSWLKRNKAQKHQDILFWNNSLSLTNTRWVRSTFSSRCSLSSKQRCWLSSATTTIFSFEKKIGKAGNWTQSSCIRELPTTVLCCLPNVKIYI